MKPTLDVVGPVNRWFSAWIGGSILESSWSDMYEDIAITKAEYGECDSYIVHCMYIYMYSHLREISRSTVHAGEMSLLGVLYDFTQPGSRGGE